KTYDLREEPVHVVLVLTARPDQYALVTAGSRPDLAGDFPAAQFWHRNVEHDYVGIESMNGIQDLATVVHAAHLVPFFSQQHHEREHGVALVIGDEDAQGARALGRFG